MFTVGQRVRYRTVNAQRQRLYFGATILKIEERRDTTASGLGVQGTLVTILLDNGVQRSVWSTTLEKV